MTDPQGRQARRPADRAADQARPGGESQGRGGDRAHRAAALSGSRRPGDRVRRRAFITLVGGAAAAWPLAARAQQMRRIGIMIALPEGDPELKKWLTAFRQRLEILGWSEGRNVQIDYRFSPAGARAAEFAKELLALNPDVILAFSTPVAAAFQRESARNRQRKSAVARTPVAEVGQLLGRVKEFRDSSPVFPSSSRARDCCRLTPSFRTTASSVWSRPLRPEIRLRTFCSRRNSPDLFSSCIRGGTRPR
jgi:hypothetical protein